MKKSCFIYLCLILLTTISLGLAGCSSSEKSIIIQESATYGPENEIEEIAGNVTVRVGDVLLQNKVIQGNLYLSSNISEGYVKLHNVTVNGNMVISGALKEVLFKDSTVNNLVVNTGNTQLYFEVDNSEIINTRLESGVEIKEINRGSNVSFTNLIIDSNKEIKISGTINNLSVEKSNAQITITEGEILLFIVKEGANNTFITINSNGLLKKLELNATTVVIGMGVIEMAVVNAESHFELIPLYYTVKEDVYVIIGDEIFNEPVEVEDSDEEKVEDSEEIEEIEEKAERPETPRDFSASYNKNSGSVVLTWQSADDETDRFTLTKNGSVVTTISGTRYTDSNINSGTTYNYSLVAVNEEGYFSWPARLSITIPEKESPPPPPTEPEEEEPNDSDNGNETGDNNDENGDNNNGENGTNNDENGDNNNGDDDSNNDENGDDND